MNECRLPPLDDLEDRGFWMTPFFHIVEVEPLRVVAIIGFENKNPFLLIQSKKGKHDLAAFSVSESPRLVWGSHFSKEKIIIQFVIDYRKALIDHWNGEIDSMDLSRIIGEKVLGKNARYLYWTKRLWGRKVLEIEITDEGLHGSRNIGISFRLNSRNHHAGLYFYLFYWRHTFSFNIYDGRHWCFEHFCWFDEDKHPYHDDETD